MFVITCENFIKLNLVILVLEKKTYIFVNYDLNFKLDLLKSRIFLFNNSNCHNILVNF